MSDGTKIEWTEATWNPIVGCTIESPGCKNCYAMGMAYRLEAMASKPDGSGNFHLDHYKGTTALSRKGKPVWTGKLGFSEEALDAPLRRKKPTMYFVNSMGDLFHEDVPDEWIDRVFAVMALCPQHTFQVLTKRSARMREYLCSIDNNDGTRLHGQEWRGALIEGMAQKLWHERTGDQSVEEWLAVQLPLPNVWLGVSAEDQARAAERTPDLLATPAAVRWLSCEPLLGPVDLTHVEPEGIILLDALNGFECVGPAVVGFDGALDWIVVGGESGPGARPMHPDWARSLRDQCEAAAVPFFFKQWGEWREVDGPKTKVSNRVMGAGTHWLMPDGQLFDRSDSTAPSASAYHHYLVARLGKKEAGRLLDGVEHNAMPGGARK